MGSRLDGDSATEGILRDWAEADRPSQKTSRRIEAIEEVISYWVPISHERDLRIEALERRLARLEQEQVPADYGCVVELAARVDTLEMTLWELGRRLNLP